MLLSGFDSSYGNFCCMEDEICMDIELCDGYVTLSLLTAAAATGGTPVDKIVAVYVESMS
jgi:hypothetical protein